MRHEFINESPQRIDTGPPNTIESEIQVAGLDGAAIREVEVRVDINHTFTGDVILSLRSPAGTEVLRKVVRADVCHSDLHIIDGHYDLGEEGELRMADPGMKLPRTLGHETLGEVVAVGPLAAPLQSGRRMLVFP